MLSDTASSNCHPEDGHRFVFIGGLHRSGTSALCALIGAHPDASRLTNTGKIEDEGQFLQSTYPADDALGGAERFALHPGAHMTEAAPDACTAGAALFQAWAPYWDLSKTVLCEKTPANMVRSRFLQAALPNSSFLFVSRHPVACVLAIRKWEYELYRLPLTLLFRNWIAAHRLMKADMPHLKRALWLRYEDLTAAPALHLRRIEKFLQIAPGLEPSRLRQGMNGRYFEIWRQRSFRKGPQPLRNILKRLWCEAEVRWVEQRYELALNEFGYSFGDVITQQHRHAPAAQTARSSP